MSVKYNGYNAQCLTMENENAVVGSVVSINSSGKACQAQQNDKIAGVCVGVRGDYAVVQTHGYVVCSYTGEPSYGVSSFLANTNNRVTPVEISNGGRSVIVLDIDYDNNKVGFVLC